MSKFHPLKVSEVKRETSDTVSVAFELPAELRNEYKYIQGQYLTFRFVINGEELRRSYSLCSSPYIGEPMRVAVKEVENGRISSYFNRQVKVGDVIETMPPSGNFHTELKAGNKKHYVAFAAGSGITPMFSILKSVLTQEPESKFTLIYANKKPDSVIFSGELTGLENANKGRLNIVHVFSRENTADPLYHGRLDKEKSAAIAKANNLLSADEYFICGPEEMIMSVSSMLTDNNVSKDKIHFELFTTPVKMAENSHGTDAHFTGTSQVKVIIDGIETEFALEGNGLNILDAAMDAGADAPFSCKGAVCCTCKAKILEGKAVMDMNYSLTDKEVAEGYILTCQAHPQSEKVVVDYDVA